MRRPALALSSAALAVSLLAGSPPAQADTPQQRRLQLTIEMTRDGDVSNGAERGRERRTQLWNVSAVLGSDGSPTVWNPLDPDDSRRQLERAQRAAQTPASHRAATPSAADVQALQARAQALQARCGNDRECLMREASALSAAQLSAQGPGLDAAAQARLQGYGQAAAACERQAGKAREACLANARRQAGGTADDGPRDDAPDERYLVFTGSAACQLDVTVKVDARTEGSFGDVQGIVPFTETEVGEERQRDNTRCPSIQAVLDTKTGRLWTYLALLPQDARGTSSREVRGRRPQRNDGRVGLRWMEAQTWVEQHLLNLNAQGGADQVLLKVAGGQADVRLRWKFERL